MSRRRKVIATFISGHMKLAAKSCPCSKQRWEKRQFCSTWSIIEKIKERNRERPALPATVYHAPQFFPNIINVPQNGTLFSHVINLREIWGMKLSLTVWEKRISPFFNRARMLFVVNIVKSTESGRHFKPSHYESPFSRAEKLSELGIEAV